MANYSKQTLEETIKAWQPQYKETLTMDDAREILDNLIAVVRWYQRSKAKSAERDFLKTLPMEWQIALNLENLQTKPLNWLDSETPDKTDGLDWFVNLHTAV